MLTGGIVLGLTAAAVLGVIVGWLLKSWLVGNVELVWRAKIDETDKALQLMAEDSSIRLARLHGDIADRDRRIEELEYLLGRRSRPDSEGANEGDDAVAKVADRDEELAACRGRLAGLVTDLAHQRSGVGEAEAGSGAVSAIRQPAHRDASRRSAEDLEKTPHPVRGTYAVFRSDKDRQYYFRFMTAHHETVLRSESYRSRSSCETGVDSVLENAALPQRIHRRRAINGAYNFHVLSANGESLGMSAFFRNRDAMARAIALFQPGTEWRRVEIAKPSNGSRPSETAPSPGDQRDDLKAIRGIGPKLEATLNRLGVHRFEQIAAWGRADIQQISSHIEVFPKRIITDDWVGGAKQQLEKYGDRV